MPEGPGVDLVLGVLGVPEDEHHHALHLVHVPCQRLCGVGSKKAVYHQEGGGELEEVKEKRRCGKHKWIIYFENIKLNTPKLHTKL